MSQLTTSAFLSKWATLFADNSTRDISEEDARDFRQDIADSFLNTADRDYDSVMVLRSAYDASTDLFPDVGSGSAADGSIQSGDIYPISTGGTMGGDDYEAGDLVLALTDAPGQTAANWLGLRFGIGGGSQDLQSVLDVGATANITGPLAVISDDTVTFEGTSVGLSSATAGLNVANTVNIAAGGIAYPWPTSAPAANGYALISQTDGTLSWGGALILSADPLVALGAATKQYVDAAVVGLWDDRGNFDASVNAYPSSGGSGSGGAILKGDIWTISVAGTLPTGQVVEAGDTVRALVDTPGNTQANWGISQNNIGYTPLTSTLASANFFVGNGSNVATAVAMSGEATLANTGAVTLSNAAVIAKVLTGYTLGAGTVAATDTILQAIQKLAGNDALSWKLTGTSTLTGTTTIANGGNNLTFSGAGTHSFSSTSATNAGNFTVGGSYTVPAGGAVNSYLQVFNGTITSKGTANDSIIGTRFNHTLTNSTGGAVAHIGVRIDATATGSTTPATAVALQVLGMTSSATANEIIRGISNLGINRWQLRNDGTQLWTSTTTGSDLGGSMATNATNGSGHLLMSFSVAGSVTTAHTHFGLKATGGVTTNATNTTYYSFWDNRSLVANNTGLVAYGFSYQPVVTGTQSGTETLYAFTSNAGLWGVGTLTPTALLHVSASTTARASLRIESGTAPTSPNNGDIWFDGTDIKMRVGGVTKTFTLV